MREIEILYQNDDKKTHIVYLLYNHKTIAIYDSKKDELIIKEASKDNVLMFAQDELKQVFIDAIQYERSKYN